MSRVLIVDDEPSICWGFREFLTEDGHDVQIAASAEEAIGLVEQDRPDVVVMDVRLPGMDGLSAIEHLRQRIDDVPIIVITAFGNLETAVRAVQQGAFDYLPKPFDLDQAAEVLRRALEPRPSEAGPQSGPSDEATDETIIGSTPCMQEVFKQIALVASTDVSVLVTGESGTGKELIARAIHRSSGRHTGPFLPICLAALSPGVVESELFGHAKGAFTGADQDRQGLLELAGGGSVFLDEIAETSIALQVKLLRTIEQRDVTPVGTARPRPIDVRIIAATNRPLADLIQNGEFREDLYYRLGVFRIQVPPLRERLGDVAPLAEHFLRRCQPDTAECTISDDVLDELTARRWNGNVRELRNVIEHAVILSRGQRIRPEHLPAPEQPGAAPAGSSADVLSRTVTEWTRLQHAAGEHREQARLYERFLALIEPPLLQTVLAECDNNRAAAAAVLGIHRATLRQKLKKYGIG